MPTTAPRWELDVRRGPGWLLVKPMAPRDNAPHSSSLLDELWALLESHLMYRLVVELDSIRTLDRKLLGQLMRLCRRVRQHGGVMRLCGLSPASRRVLVEEGLSDWLPVYEDAEEAVMGSSRKPR